MGDTNGTETFDIPAECIGGVVVNEGENFEVQVRQVPVPEIGMPTPIPTREHGTNIIRSGRRTHQAECDGSVHVRCSFHVERLG